MKNLLSIIALLVVLAACNNKPKQESYNWNDDLKHRLLVDFNKSEAHVKEYIQRYIPEVTDQQMRQWEESKALEFMVNECDN